MNGLARVGLNSSDLASGKW